MSSLPQDTPALFGLRDLGMAYRKVKADLFYSSRMCRRELLEFESRLSANLTRLQKRLQSGRPPNLPAESWTVAPKSMSVSESKSVEHDGFVDSDAASRWRAYSERSDVLTADFRRLEIIQAARKAGK